MANNSQIKALINEKITTNGTGAITGSELNNVLTQMVLLIGQGRAFAGIATPSGTPSTYDRNVFWLALVAGTYSNFGNLEIENGLTVILYSENDEGVGSYSKIPLFAVDTTPTQNSANLVGSGAVFAAIRSAVESVEVGATEIYDISAVNAISGVPAAYATLQAALSFVPTAYQRGGISVKYVDSVTNGYVQYRLTSQTWSTSSSDWEKASGSNIVQHGASEVTVTIDPNNLHIWNTPMGALHITLGTAAAGQINEYMIRFTVPTDTTPQITFQPSVRWVEEPEWESGNTYEISIVNGLAVYAERKER